MKYRERMGDVFQISYQAFTICIFIIVLSIAAMCFKFVQATRDDTIARSQRTVQHINQSVDMALKKVNEGIMQLATNYLVMNYMNYYNELDYSTLLKADEFFLSFLSVNNYIQDIEIYYFDENTVYSSRSGVFGLEAFYDKAYIYSLKSDPSTINAVIRRAVTNASGGNPQEVITIAKTLPLLSSTPRAIVIVNIASGYFESFVNDANLGGEMSIILTNADGEPLVKPATVERIDELISATIEISTQGKRHFVSNDNIISYSISEHSNWTCIGITPQSAVYRGLYSLWLFVTILAAVLLIASVAFSIVFARKMYRPLATLAGFFNHGNSKVGNNIHEYIQSNVADVLEKNKALEDLVNEFQPVIRSNFVASLLAGDMENGEQAIKQAEDFGLNITEHPYYTVYIVSYRNNVSYNDYSHKQKVMMRIYILEILNTYISSQHKGIVCESGVNEISIILNHSTNSLDDCAGIGKEIHAFLLENLSYATDVTIGMGNCAQGIINIPDSRQEALQALRMSFVTGHNKFICFRNIQQMNNNYYNYPYRKEEEMLNHLRKYDIRSAQKTRDEIILTLTSADAYVASYVYLQLMCAIVRLVNELGGSSGMDNDEFNIYKIMKNVSSVDELRPFFDALFQRVATLIIDKKENKNKFLIEKIKSYIDENISKDISLEALAEQAFFSTTYLSKLFKQETAMNIRDYVDAARIDKAKSLLANSQYSIQQIGEMIGYARAQTFIKFFKRHMSVTPGEFRRNVKEQ